MLKRVAFVSAVLAAACGGDSGSSKKKVGPSDPKGLASKPDDAESRGNTTSISPPGGGPAISTAQAGDDGDPMWCWTEDIDEDGSEDDCCVVEDDETGALVLACAPFVDECEDGSELEAGLIVVVDEDGSGTFALAGDDLCGLGADLFGCDFDADGEIGACGACVVDGDELVCEDDDGGGDECDPEEEDCDDECDPEEEDCDDEDDDDEDDDDEDEDDEDEDDDEDDEDNNEDDDNW